RAAVRHAVARRPRGERARAQANRGRATGRRHHCRRGVRPRSATAAPERAMMILALAAQTLRIAIPYLFATAGGIMSERAGLIGLSLEGYMLGGAFCAALAAYYSGNPWIGLLAAAAGGIALAMVYAVSAIRFLADQVVVG